MAPLGLVALVATGSCMPPDEPGLPPPATIEPEVRVALAENGARPRLSAAGGLRVIDPD